MGLFDTFNPLTLAGATQGALQGRQQRIAQGNVENQQAIERYNIDQMRERQSRLASLQYANQIGEKLLDQNFLADANRSGTLPAWQQMRDRHYLYGSGNYGVDVLDPKTPLPQSTGPGLGDESGEPDNGAGLNIILPAHLGGGSGGSAPQGTGGSQGARLPGADTGRGGSTPTDPNAAPDAAGPDASTPFGAAVLGNAIMQDQPGYGPANTPFVPVGETADEPAPIIQQGQAAPVPPGDGGASAGAAPGTTANPLLPRDNGETVQPPLGQDGGAPISVTAKTKTVVMPPAGTERGIDAAVFRNELMAPLEAARLVMDGAYSSDRRLDAAAQYTKTMTQMLTNQLTGNQIVQLREQLALLPADAQAALIDHLSQAAEHDANAKATLDLIIPTALKFKGEAKLAQANAGLATVQGQQLPNQVGAQVATAEAAKISAKASYKEAQVRQNELQQQIVQWGQAPGRQAAATYFQTLASHMYQTRTHQVSIGVGGQGKALGGIIGAGGHGNYGGQEIYPVLDTAVAVQLVAAGFPGAWASLSQARIRGVDTPGGSSTPIPDDDTLRGAVLEINGAQAALQAAGPPGSKGYQQVFGLIQKGQKWLSTLPASLAKTGPSSPDNAMRGKTYDTGGTGGNSVSDRLQGGILGAGKTAGSIWNFLNTPLPGTLHGKK